jgi:hypothetical protein
MVPRRAGECNEGILVCTSGSGLVWSAACTGLEAISSSLEDRSRDQEGAGLGEPGQKGEDGKGQRADDLLHAELTKCDGCSPGARLFLVLPHVQQLQVQGI